MSTIRVVVEGHNLPGRECGPHNHVHVGLQVGNAPAGVVPGDAESARWETDLRVVDVDQGHDFRGPAVHGKRAERYLYITWGEVVGPHFSMFRRAKLMLDRIDPALVTDAVQRSARLHAKVDLTDAQGMPRCARVDPPAIEWSVGSSE